MVELAPELRILLLVDCMPMAKVAHLTSAHPATDIRILYKECVSLRAAGFDVVLVAPGAESKEFAGVRIRSVPRPYGRWRRMTQTTVAVVRAARSENADIYHLHDPELLPWVPFLRRGGKQIIFDMHENMAMAIANKPYLPPRVRRALGYVYAVGEKMLLNKVPVIFAETSYRKYYPQIKQQAVVLNMPLVDELLDNPRNKNDQFTVGYLGRVAQKRGSMIMLQAVHDLQQRGITVQFDCVGPVAAYHRQALQSMIQSLGLQDIRIHGYQLPHKGWGIMAHCHVGLAILQDVPNYRESYPTKLFEYMALGLPVVTSNFPLYRSIIEKEACGLCIDPGNAEAVAEALYWLYEHPQEASAMGQRGRKAVREKFNWQMEADKLLAFYRQVLA